MATERRLPEGARLQLDGIVQRMIADGQPDETIRLVVDDFKGKYGIPEVGPPTTSELQGIARTGVHGLTVGLPAAIGAGLGATSIPATGPAGPVIGAGVGAGTGQAAWQAVEPFLPEAIFGPSPGIPPLREQFRQIGTEAMYGPMYEMGGQIVGRGLQAALAPRAGRVTQEGRRLLETGEAAGFTPSPSDVAPGGLLGRAEALAEKQFGGGRITQAAEREIQAMRGSPVTGAEGYLTRRAREVAGPSGQIDATRVARGETIQRGLEDIAQAHRVGESVEWEFPRAKETGVPDFQIDNLREYMRTRLTERVDLQQAVSPTTQTRLSTPGGKIVKTKGKTKAVELGPEGYPAFASAETGEPVPLLEARGRRTIPPGERIFMTERATPSGMTSEQMVAGLAQGEQPITLRQAMVLRKRLGEMYQAGDRGPLAAFRRDMDADAGLNPQRADAWQKAREYTKEWIVPFRSEEPLGRLIDKQEPVAVVQELMAAKDARITMLRAVHKQTGGSGPVWDAIQAEGLTQAIENPRMLKQLGPETRQLLFSQEQRTFFNELQNWQKTSSAAMKEGKGLFARTGTNIVGWDQLRHGLTLTFGAVGAGAGGAYAGRPILGAATGMTLLLSPSIVAKLVTNPTTARWLSVGLRTPAGTSESVRVISQILPRYLSVLGEERQSQ